MSYSQNDEEKFITGFFTGFTGRLLDIGANDGKTFSNSLRLIESGWRAILVEPSNDAYLRLCNLHRDNVLVNCIKAAVGEKNGPQKLNVSKHHLPDNKDVALLSSLNYDETERWRKAGVDFYEEEVDVITYSDFKKWADLVGFRDFEFITIDAEGNDLEILKQIDLSFTKLLCVEHNSIPETRAAIFEYCAKFGMTKILYENGENLLICREQ